MLAVGSWQLAVGSWQLAHNVESVVTACPDKGQISDQFSH